MPQTLHVRHAGQSQQFNIEVNENDRSALQQAAELMGLPNHALEDYSVVRNPTENTVIVRPQAVYG